MSDCIADSRIRDHCHGGASNSHATRQCLSHIHTYNANRKINESKQICYIAPYSRVRSNQRCVVWTVMPDAPGKPMLNGSNTTVRNATRLLIDTILLRFAFGLVGLRKLDTTLSGDHLTCSSTYIGFHRSSIIIVSKHSIFYQE